MNGVLEQVSGQVTCSPWGW